MKKSIFNAFSKIGKKASELTRRMQRRKINPSSVSHDHSRKGKKGLVLSKRKLAFVLAIVIVVVAVPVLFATASNSNAVAKITEINLEAAASAQPVEDDTSDLFEGVTEAAVTDGELTSDLTESGAQASAVAAEASPAPSETVYTSFSLGMEDPFVAIIQQRLMDLDYMENDEPTTLFGPITAQAIGYFQRKMELPIDGVAGPDTQKRLFADDAKYYTVSEGADGTDVESLQDRLYELGYGVGSTGYFGSDTTEAVAYFQRMNGLTDDGNVGSETREALYSNEAEPAAEHVAHSSSSSSEDTSSGSSGGEAPAANPGSVEAFISAALAQLGDPYVRGGKGPDTFDCSGLVYYALNASGNSIGYMTSGGWAGSGYTRIDNMSDLQRGDVICVSGHVAIYLGGGDVVHASSSNGAVVYGNIGSNYWSSNWICGRRPL